MPEHDPGLYDSHWADIYDEFYDSVPDETDCIECLATLAGRGPVLELGIGSGRIALPLARRGIEVHGIDSSPNMVGRLRKKPGSDRVVVQIGDFADVAVEGKYTLIYVVFNTFFHLNTQEDQVRCVVNAAQHLSADGLFVVEVVLPGSSHSVLRMRCERTA